MKLTPYFSSGILIIGFFYFSLLFSYPFFVLLAGMMGDSKLEYPIPTDFFTRFLVGSLLSAMVIMGFLGRLKNYSAEIKLNQDTARYDYITSRHLNQIFIHVIFVGFLYLLRISGDYEQITATKETTEWLFLSFPNYLWNEPSTAIVLLEILFTSYLAMLTCWAGIRKTQRLSDTKTNFVKLTITLFYFLSGIVVFFLPTMTSQEFVEGFKTFINTTTTKTTAGEEFTELEMLLLVALSMITAGYILSWLRAKSPFTWFITAVSPLLKYQSRYETEIEDGIEARKLKTQWAEKERHYEDAYTSPEDRRLREITDRAPLGATSGGATMRESYDLGAQHTREAICRKLNTRQGTAITSALIQEITGVDPSTMEEK